MYLMKRLQALSGKKIVFRLSHQNMLLLKGML